MYMKSSTVKALASQGIDLPILLMGACVGNVVMVSELKDDGFAMFSNMEHQYFDLRGDAEWESMNALEKANCMVDSVDEIMNRIKESLNNRDSDCDCSKYSEDGKWTYTVTDAVKRWERDNV